MEYKDTLNLPKTDFPMKANLPNREPDILKSWAKHSIFQKVLNQSKQSKKYVLHDGPPYANGDIHIGHAVNKILKDFIIKSKIMSGYHTPFTPGWDCHGLPIELQVEKKYGKGKFKDNPNAFVAACREFAKKQIEKQKADFIRLGVFADWDNPYTSMDKEVEAGIVKSLSKIIDNNHIYFGSKPVHWCIESSSALAEAEVEYKDIVSKAVCVKFRITSSSELTFTNNIDKKAHISIPIWTTTPWTLPANRAVAISKNVDYSLVQVDKNYLIIAKKLVDSVMEKAGISEFKIIEESIKSEMSTAMLEHPFYCLLYTSPSPRDLSTSRMPSSA